MDESSLESYRSYLYLQGLIYTSTQESYACSTDLNGSMCFVQERCAHGDIVERMTVYSVYATCGYSTVCRVAPSLTYGPTYNSHGRFPYF